MENEENLIIESKKEIDTNEYKAWALRSYLNSKDFNDRLHTVLTMLMIKPRIRKELKCLTCATDWQIDKVLEELMNKKQIKYKKKTRQYIYIAGLNFII